MTDGPGSSIIATVSQCIYHCIGRLLCNSIFCSIHSSYCFRLRIYVHRDVLSSYLKNLVFWGVVERYRAPLIDKKKRRQKSGAPIYRSMRRPNHGIFDNTTTKCIHTYCIYSEAQGSDGQRGTGTCFIGRPVDGDALTPSAPWTHAC